ncbi:MAG: hypothetical protein Q4A74_08365, partial [Cardiobacteriaceae bacterium]|nr:hypothetical protein [Cardiobacteriaceae bacterium]
MSIELERISEEEEVIENAIPPADIFAFNESRSCADLKRMYDKKQIDIHPETCAKTSNSSTHSFFNT